MTDQIETKPDPSDGSPVFRLDLSGCEGTGRPLPDGRFLVQAGAVGRVETTPAFGAPGRPYQAGRDCLVEEGAFEIDGDRLVLTRDTPFKTPTYATCILSGRRMYGYDKWKNEDGQTLRNYLDTHTGSTIDGAAHPGQVSPAELEFRQMWYEAHAARFLADEDHYQEAKAATDGFDASADEALLLLAELRRAGDVQSFKERMEVWSRKPGTLAFKGQSGQMMLNQLVNRSEDHHGLAILLADSLATPTSDEEAVTKIQRVVEHVKSVKVGSHPAPGNVPFLLSYFWALADRERWPVIWPSAARFIEFSTGESLPGGPPERYRVFVERVRELTSDHVEFETTAAWWHSERPVFIDDVLSERVTLGLDAEGASTAEREANARAMVSIAKFWGDQLVEKVTSALDRETTVGKPPLDWTPTYPRADLWVDWNAKNVSGLGIRVWVNDRGAAVALRPGLVREGWWDEIAPILEAADYPDCRVLGGAESRIGDDVGFYGRRGEFVYGRWFERDEFHRIDLAATVLEVAVLLKPLFDELLARATGEPLVPPTGDGDPIASFVNKFRTEEGYPRHWDEDHRAEQRRFAGMLKPESIALAERTEIRRIWSGGGYGGTGPMPLLNRSFNEADESEYDRMMESLRYLCWGDDSDAERIDRLLMDDQFRIKGLGESVIMKLLAITHPYKYLCVYPQGGEKGKRAMLALIGLDEPTGSRGEVHVESNRILRDRLAPFFPDDPWGMSQFLYWYQWQLTLEEGTTDPLGVLAEKLLVDPGFLEDIVKLLEDKGQVIFYGPPGTGKTYLARELARVLAPDPGQRALVQFHPSSSYEDFFEGYRPQADGGDMIYELTPGPLADMAQRAADSAGRRHVMIIDEINRANLPKVFGELLFMLEYRDESVRTLYRPDDTFELPRNLWFIGTMNTADRSIALVDAALRRRFHFIPFFPNRWPMEGLLERWLAENDEPNWVGELVAQVNDELDRELGGPHLLLGPSHFMKQGLDEEAMRRIWKYNIEPFIEDQFFGDREQIEYFRFDQVYKRYLDLSGRAEMAEQETAVQRAAADPEFTTESNSDL